MIQVRVTGAEDFARLARRLRRAGGRELVDELRQELREAAEPAVLAARREVRALPARGPRTTRLRARTAAAVRLQASGRTGVRIQVPRTPSLGMMPRHLNRGRWRKPLWGDRAHWFTQTTRPGWFDRPMRDARPEFVDGARAAMDRVARRITD
ncbi:hypothetical protein [Actinomadura alba]|uniref:HK97 gp10 family phage protein n=1 Tax=Actinomadura alba TaxID=406431 RepID=A0ABR7LHC1_9ACTN|nr:hypothetical protein [Actinomadura alba]MBC6464254.1 hypothetical protein [Actinomadura alba]